MPRLLHIVLCTALPLAACTAPTPAPAPAPAAAVDLSGAKTYLTDKTAALVAAAQVMQRHSDVYFGLAQEVGFDYAGLWTSQANAARAAIEAARAAWMTASPLYEQMEGIVAGVPDLADYDVILDAGTSATEDLAGAVPFDLTLGDGRVLAKPGNLFGVTEATLWGTYPEYRAPIDADWDGDGTLAFGEALPDAHVLKASIDTLVAYALELDTAAQAWTPTEAQAFGALVTMIPTMSEYFNSWKASRFVTGEASTQRDFVAISRLADIGNILGGLEVVYGNVRPLVANEDPAVADQIAQDMASLRTFVADIHAQEQAGQRFTPEEADTLGADAQNRATAITGLITQMVARLGIELDD